MTENEKTKKVQVEISTEINQDGNVERHHFEENGQLVTINGNRYLRYVEHVTGQPDVPVTYRIGKDSIRLTRAGENHLELHFKPNETIEDLYRTPYGNLKIGAHTTSIKQSKDAQTGLEIIEINYELYTNGQKVGDYRVKLQFKC
ncbi:DUF1934 domain-containing protein [Fructilactobacillus fructivorans]|uniref:DUF1934 domain-containing protein n=2 Tax=Fructilactobacillus fructivorans TaxID=1614 RepID=A0A0C1PK01_9LACO|nr:DUF1934 domain-containing protein [Fructilactobacillus fructivorans]KID41047.1 DUF1934 domain-containing protein [Fructilactobacillus fructivorans]